MGSKQSNESKSFGHPEVGMDGEYPFQDKEEYRCSDYHYVGQRHRTVNIGRTEIMP
jgi:hypothetical protein